MGVDADGKPTTPVYLWADTRSREDVDAIKQEFDAHELWQRTGCFVHSSYWPGKLRWLARTQPDLVKATSTWCSFSGYLLRRFFGAEGTSISMASSTAMMNATTQQWDDLRSKPPALIPISWRRSAMSGNRWRAWRRNMPGDGRPLLRCRGFAGSATVPAPMSDRADLARTGSR